MNRRTNHSQANIFSHTTDNEHKDGPESPEYTLYTPPRAMHLHNLCQPLYHERKVRPPEYAQDPNHLPISESENQQSTT